MTSGVDPRTRLTDLIAKGELVLQTKREGAVDSGAFAEWRAQSLSFLRGLFGPSHTYAEDFERKVTDTWSHETQHGLGVLRAALEDVELGIHGGIRALLAGEIFTDFLEMASHLLAEGFYAPAASLAGAVLEDGLRQIGSRHGEKVRDRDDATSLNTRFGQSGIYTRLNQKRVQTAIDVRNLADHGRFEDFRAEDVRLMLATVEAFLAEHLGVADGRSG